MVQCDMESHGGCPLWPFIAMAIITQAAVLNTSGLAFLKLPKYKNQNREYQLKRNNIILINIDPLNHTHCAVV